ncbi:hypothetical protein KIPB_012714 [Kipferlia bialata]|uniref:Uncharacterized protein n=1 Tax=Kipferlia bialata TaxID=797122 RepID=A0A9K3D8A3_9EUKA|nr:hypothetical protein KIPB_012714 [Kipferlia bialata]|eukprot:g12714.t1
MCRDPVTLCIRLEKSGNTGRMDLAAKWASICQLVYLNLRQILSIKKAIMTLPLILVIYGGMLACIDIFLYPLLTFGDNDNDKNVNAILGLDSPGSTILQLDYTPGDAPSLTRNDIGYLDSEHVSGWMAGIDHVGSPPGAVLPSALWYETDSALAANLTSPYQPGTGFMSLSIHTLPSPTCSSLDIGLGYSSLVDSTVAYSMTDVDVFGDDYLVGYGAGVPVMAHQAAKATLKQVGGG